MFGWPEVMRREPDELFERELWFRARVSCSPWSITPSKIEFDCFKVVRHTPKGVWLQSEGCDEFFVLGRARRQYALPAVDLAIEDLIDRKRRNVTYKMAHLASAEKELREAILARDTYKTVRDISKI